MRCLFVLIMTWSAIGYCCIGIAGDAVASALDDGITVDSDDWPWWRGPSRDGIAAADQQPPRRWSETENVLWKAPIPGRGHGSPTVADKHVFLATADRQRQTQSVLCLGSANSDR